MNPYWMLLPVAILCVIGSWASYVDWARRSDWYTPLMAILAAGCGLFFGYAAKLLDTKAGVYLFSLYYDSIMMVAYYVLPLLVFSTKVTPGVMVGAALVAAGLIVAKIFG